MILAFRFSLLCITLFVGLFPTIGAAADEASQQIEFFENEIRPLLSKHCFACHSQSASDSGKLKGGLLLDDRAGLRRGGESGVAIVPGNAADSLLMSALRHEDLEMPPKGKLPEAAIANFAKWINMGAPDPRDGKGVIRKTIDLERGREFWSYQPIAATRAPIANDEAWNKNAIDQFVISKMAQQGLQPVALAKPTALIRRLYFDLIGIPPGPKELKRWEARLKEDRETGLQELIDSLLSSDQFGERWGRHWLDVARFAESNGNSRNSTFPHAWRYRDYVIDAFNADIPYDEFIKQQIAGDLLPFASPSERNRNLIATGFLALGSKPVIRGKGAFVPDIVADQIEVVSRSVLGLTVACARCHDHKFDPIPTADYYGLAGIFASSETLYGGGGKAMNGAPATGLHALTSEDQTQATQYAKWQTELADANKQLQQLNAERKKLRPRKGKGKKKAGTKKAGKKAAQGKVDPKELQSQKERLAQLTQDINKQTDVIKALRSRAPASPASAMGVRERDTPLEVPVYVRGETPKGDKVPRRLLSVLCEDDGDEDDEDNVAYTFPTDGSGRLQLAEWLVRSDSALAARVMANRVWLHLFGQGIVGTPDNFGVNGDRPTHPELLDHLAQTFINEGWSVKRLIRQIVSTRAYQLSDAFDSDNQTVDPLNQFVWRHSQRRLEAEAIRDAMLVASGRLKVDRPAGSVVSQYGGKLIQDSLTPDTIHRPSDHRSIYLPILRNGLPEALEVFDMADPSLVVGRRDVTIVPSQDLYLMNNSFVIQQAVDFAKRVILSADTESDRVHMAYQIALSRSPTQVESDRAVRFIKETRESLEGDGSPDESTLESWSAFCQALFVSTEFRHTR